MRRIAGSGARSLGSGRRARYSNPAAIVFVLLSCAASAHAQTISANSDHVLVVKPDGTVWAWGANGSGQIGDNSTTRRDLPTQVSGLTGVVAVAAGVNHSLALKSDGTLWAWGANSNGQLGQGTSGGTPQKVPIQVSNLSNVVAVTAGSSYSVAVKSDGTVWVWGANNNSQLGDGTTTQRTSPVQLTSIGNVVAVSSRAGHTLALKNDDTVVAWGANGNGQLGIGSTSPTTTPVAVTGLTGVTAIAAGDSHSLALLTGGTAKAWGANLQGQLGDGSTTQRTSPVSVSTLGSIAVISAGGTHSAAVTTGGSAFAWGNNANGQLGDGSDDPATTPLAVANPSSVDAVMAGQSFTLFLTPDETLWACGRNHTGQIGDGTLVTRLSPVKVSETTYVWKVGTPTFSVNTGTYTSVQNVTVASVTSGATIHYTTNGADPTESDPTVPGNGIVTVSESLTLKAKAWKTGIPESNVDGKTYTLKVATPTLSPGTGTYTIPKTVTVNNSVSGVSLHYTTTGADPLETDPTVAAGGTVAVNQSLVLKVRGWRTGWVVSDAVTGTYTLKVATPTLTPTGGTYTAAQNVTATTTSPDATLRYTTSGQEPLPTDPEVTSSIAVGTAATLRVKGSRTGWTDSDTAIATYTFNLGTVATPTFTPIGGTYTAGQSVTLETTTSGAVIRYTTDGTEPTVLSKQYTGDVVVASPMTLKARAFKADWTASATATAAYDFDYGTVAQPTFGPPGGDYTSRRDVTVSTATAGATIRYTTNGLEPTESDTTIASGSPITVDLSMRLRAKAFKSGLTPSPTTTADYWVTGTVAAGGNHTLALKADGTVWSWGANGLGQLGDDTTDSRDTPVQVIGLTDVVAIAAGHTHSLAAKRDGTVWAWGNNGNRQLGDNTNVPRRETPVQTFGITDVVAVAAGESHSLALKKDGTVCAWGGGSSGQIGDGFTTQRPTPVCLSLPTGVVAIAAGAQHSLALKTDGGASGTVWAWGYNFWGAIGDGSTTSIRPSPLNVLGGATAVGAGERHSLAALADGTARAWGHNGPGKLGNNSITDSKVPVVVQDLDGVVAITGGDIHSLARTSESTVWGWGDVLLNLILSPYFPYRIPGTGTTAIAAAAGGSHSVVAQRDGSVWTWGLNTSGQLGKGSTGNSSYPVKLASFSLVSADWLIGDQDGDGLATWRELELGTEPLNADSNDDGLLDGAAVTSRESATNTDMDADGVTNVTERTNGTDPFRADSDDDGVNDAADAFPLDPSRSQPLQPTPGDTTPPCIVLIYPTNAVLILGGCS
jgi:alpha-tubulin suppressor-like RCC1 family protein